MSLEDSMSDFFQHVADAFLRGDHKWLSSIYSYPLAIYIEGEIAIEKTPIDTLNSLWRRREYALSVGTVEIKSEVVEIGEIKSGRIPVRVDWYFLNAQGNVIAVNELRYFCRVQNGNSPKIEILEFLRRGLSDRRFAMH